METKTWYQLLYKDTNVVIDFFAVIVSVVFLGILSNLTIPMFPVPITMQTFGVFLIAFFFGSRKGLIAIMTYLIVGLIGFSVFAGYKSGFSVLLGPTAGYLIGMVFMALIVGLLVEKGFGTSFVKVLFCMLVGSIILYVCGLIGLWFYLGFPSLFTVLKFGLFPFIIGDVLKALLAASLFPFVGKGLNKLYAN